MGKNDIRFVEICPILFCRCGLILQEEKLERNKYHGNIHGKSVFCMLYAV